MSASGDWLWLWLSCGLLTFAIRCSFIVLEGRYRPPGWFVRWLPFVPIAALTALTAPELLLAAGQLNLGGERLWAGLIAIAIAARWRNTLLTIAGGFTAFWLLRALA